VQNRAKIIYKALILKALQNCKFAQEEIVEVNKFENIFSKKVVQICKIL